MTDNPIVVNAGPLIALSVSGHLSLLERLYFHVLVPGAVMREVTESGAGRPGAREVAGALFLERVELDAPVDPLLAGELGAGEAEVIALAVVRKASLVLVDERRARRVAEQAYGLRVKGTAGILVAAKKQGLLARVRPVIEAMAESGYFLSARLVGRACAEADE
ncbi:MAG: DUF3368 domain-containing protein [Deltaproteobacteria bacterium]|nr:DUF3368 domain-containing protein [Deltaproteobacteria bacterium]